MPNMSFYATKTQILDEIKTVTRRNGWENLKPGQVFQAIEKGQGLKKGETVNRLKVLQCVGNRRERLYKLIDDKAYGMAEVIKEGFPQMTPMEFVEMYCRLNKGTHPGDEIGRIEFRYLLKQGPGQNGEVIRVPARVATCPSCQTEMTIYPDGWTYQEDGTVACDSFTSSCRYEPELAAPKRAWDEYEESHYQQLNQPYIYLLPTSAKIESWMMATYRFDLE